MEGNINVVVTIHYCSRIVVQQVKYKKLQISLRSIHLSFSPAQTEDPQKKSNIGCDDSSSASRRFVLSSLSSSDSNLRYMAPSTYGSPNTLTVGEAVPPADGA